MSDLISRSKLTEAIKRQYCTGCDNYNGSRCRACHADDMLSLVDDAADAMPRWISVEERLPEKFHRVLCSDGERVFQAIYTTGSRYFPDHWEEVVFLEQNSGSTKHMHEPPTHWIPMPEPPEMKEE